MSDNIYLSDNAKKFSEFFHETRTDNDIKSDREGKMTIT